MSQIGERDRYPRMPEALRSYVRTEYRGDPGVVQAWIASARGEGTAHALAAAARSAALAVARAVRSATGSVTNPGGA